MPSRSCAPHGCLQRSDSAGREDGYHDVQCSQIFNVVTKKKTSFQLFLKLVQEAFGQLVLNANKLIWLWMHERARRSCTFGSLRKTIKLSGEWFGTFLSLHLWFYHPLLLQGAQRNAYYCIFSIPFPVSPWLLRYLFYSRANRRVNDFQWLYIYLIIGCNVH